MARYGQGRLDAFDPETKVRSLEFIRTNAAANKPFYLAWWPMLTSFIPNPEKKTISRSLYTDNMQYNVDAFIGELMDELESLGIAENTLLVVMADNGPMAHNPPPGLGMVETIFRGGKGDFLEGGVRVPAFAWWPGTIEPGQLVGVIVDCCCNFSANRCSLFIRYLRPGFKSISCRLYRIVELILRSAWTIRDDVLGRRVKYRKRIFTGNFVAIDNESVFRHHAAPSLYLLLQRS